MKTNKNRKIQKKKTPQVQVPWEKNANTDVLPTYLDSNYPTFYKIRDNQIIVHLPLYPQYLIQSDFINVYL